jgi:acetoin utilization protein AcuB
MLGARDPGVRLAVLVPNVAGELAQLTKAIFDVGGNILALGTFLGESSQNREVTLKVENVDGEALVSATEPYVERVIDLRESG